MAVVPAPACKALLAEATRLWPKRSTASDGILPSNAHSIQNPKSDHELGNAVDLTDDPVDGCDAHRLAELLRQRSDGRIKYVISNRRIWTPAISRQWRPYNGTNPHTTHMHVSIHASARNSTGAWFPQTNPPPAAAPGGVMVRNYIASLVAPNGGTWHLQADGGVITDTDGAGGPEAPYLGSVPGSGGAGTARVRGILPHGQGYKIVVQHPDETISFFHYPA